ncbi:MAG: hypothetical protein M3401_07575, partial [Actinomycetota bacterium]|nr:hypothetical protein [Actinomycetota bacterium]
AWLDALGRIAYQARRMSEHVDILDFRGALPEADASAVPRLGTSALGARDLLLARLNAPQNPATRRHATLAQIS